MKIVVRLAVVVFALLGVFVACGPNESDAPTTLRVSTLPTLSFAPYYIADAEGYFADEGIEVEFIASQRGVDTLPILLQGDLDVWNGAVNAGLLNAAAAGERIRIVADKGSIPASGCSYVGYLARPDAVDADGQVLAERLLGERVPTSSALTSMYAIDQFVRSLGIDPSEVVFEAMGMGSRAAALEGGAVPVSSINEPSMTRLLQETDLVKVADAVEHVPGLPLAVVGFGPRMLDDPDLADRFMRAYLRGVHTYAEGPTESNLAILTSAIEVEESVLREACWPAISSDGRIDTDRLAAAQEWGVGAGMIDAVVDEDTYWDSSFVDRAARAIDG